MKKFTNWFSKKKTSDNLEPLKIVSNCFYHGKYRECIQKSESLFQSKDPDLQWNAKRFSGLANYRLKRFEKATRLFEEIANFSNITDDWFNLMTASIRNKELELGEGAYEKFNSESSIPGDNKMLTYSNVTYQMMIAYQDVEEYQKALEKLIVLKRYITQVKHHNSDYLGQYGIPFIYQTLVSAQACLEHEYTPEQIDRFLEDFENHVDNDGKESIAEFREKSEFKKS